MSDFNANPQLVECKRELITRHADGSAEFAISSEFACHYDRETAVLWSTINPRGIPCFSLGLLRDMEHASEVIEGFFSDSPSARPVQYIVIRSGVPRVFNVGGDLGYFQRLIAAQDRPRLTEYARTAVNVTYRNFCAHNLPDATTIALLEGDAMGGGLECALSCDIVIAVVRYRHCRGACQVRLSGSLVRHVSGNGRPFVSFPASWPKCRRRHDS
jgi:hypothetical protein